MMGADVWVVLRDLDSADPEADVFASDQAAREHMDRLIAEGHDPDQILVTEETVCERSWLADEAGAS